MGSILGNTFLNLNFVFENNKETFNGSPRYSYRGPLYNHVIDKCNYTENLEGKNLRSIRLKI